jgi:glycosyltransferase involved in cell wall biosynthesis
MTVDLVRSISIFLVTTTHRESHVANIAQSKRRTAIGRPGSNGIREVVAHDPQYPRAAQRASRLRTPTGGQPSPRITVITPAYNVQQYIGEAIDSVLAQNFGDFEYLVINDGSTDQTADEILERVKVDPRIQLINEDHCGAANARNVGIMRARGEFIAFLDGDDRWHADFLRNQLILLESAEPNVAAVFARSRVISETGRIYLLRWQRSGRYDFDDMLIQSCPPRTGSSLLIKKAAFDSAGLFNINMKSAQDLDMWLRVQCNSGLPYFLGNRKYLLDIRVRAGAISRDYKSRFEALDAVINEHAPGLRRHPKGMAYARPAVFAYRAGEDEFALRWTRLAKEAGMCQLLADSYGRRLLGWSLLSPAQRMGLRYSNLLIRFLIGRAIGAQSGIMR